MNAVSGTPISVDHGVKVSATQLQGISYYINIMAM